MMKTPPAHRRERGFTLIELMVAVAIVAILAAIAVPAYTDYILRSKIPDGTNALSAMRARLEQYYQDNRSYTGDKSPCTTAGNSDKKYFKLECTTLTKTTYTVTATGINSAAGFVFTIDNNGTEGTSHLPESWGGAVSGDGCWITKRGGSC